MHNSLILHLLDIKKKSKKLIQPSTTFKIKHFIYYNKVEVSLKNGNGKLELFTKANNTLEAPMNEQK